MEVVASLSQGRTAAAQCGFFTHKSVPVIFEPPCIIENKELEVLREKGLSRVMSSCSSGCDETDGEIPGI